MLKKLSLILLSVSLAFSTIACGNHRINVPVEQTNSNIDFAEIDNMLQSYQEQEYFPSGVLYIFDKDSLLHTMTLGEANEDSWFDMASVSKLVCNTMILFLVEEGKVTIDTPVLSILPYEGDATRERLKDVTLRQLMTHTSGIPAWYPFYADGRDFEEILEYVFETNPKEEGMVYSDINFMLMGRIFEKVSGMSLPEGLDKYIHGKLGITDITYGPMEPDLCIPSSYGNPIEKDMVKERNMSFDGWRADDKPVCGECNDGNAFYYSGDVSGHAGIFATAEAMMKLCQFYMTTDKPAFLEAMSENISGRGLGFDKGENYPEGCGHSGFTGTSVWFSKENNIGAVLLTNRLFYPSDHESPGSMNVVRRAVHYALLGKTPPE